MREELPLLHPRPFEPGCTLGVCAPAGPVDEKALSEGIAWLEDEGYAVHCATHLRSRDGYLAGTDEQRLGDLLELIRAPEVRGVVLARGGYGLARILARLDPVECREARKLFVGYSDATSLLLFLRQRTGLASVHGPMLERSGMTDAARRRWLGLVRGDEIDREALEGSGFQGGCVRGPLVGGNLTVLASSLGTPWEIDTTGAILFIEEVSEQPYVIDRNLIQLREAGKLRSIVGVAIGQLVSCESERYPERSAQEVLRRVLHGAVDGPIVEDLPFGHILDHRALGFGVRAELDGESGTLALLESVVGRED